MTQAHLRGRVWVLLIGSLLCSGAWGASQTRTSAFVYDSASGLLTKEIVEPDNSDYCLVTEYSYDSFGNKTAATMRNCNGSASEAAAPASGSLALFDARTSSSVYSPDGRFANSASNALGHTETHQFDSTTGLLQSATGPNGLTSSFQYDGFGRKTRETRPDGTYTTWEYRYCSGFNGGTEACPTINGAVGAYLVRSSVRDSSGNQIAPTAVIYYDTLDRAIRSQTQGDNGQAIYQDTRYDSKGQVIAQSRPYYGYETPKWTQYTYDDLGRLSSETAPNGLITQTTYNGLTTTVTLVNPRDGAPSQSKTTVKNVLGQVERVVDANGQVLQYQYDLFGNLTSTIDALGNTTKVDYDPRGRKIKQTDPDMGIWTYGYDALGQLRVQIDAKQQQTWMGYDKLGRMTSRIESDLTSYWNYDACTKGVGKLCSETADNGYQKVLNYDSLGRPSSASTLIDGKWYTQSTAYDTSGRVANVAYPNQMWVFYDYTGSVGNLGQVRLYNGGPDSPKVVWQRGFRLASGQTDYEVFGQEGNGDYAYGEYSYDAIGNMLSSALEYFDPVTGDSYTPPYARTYHYDRLGNVTSRTYQSGVGTSSITENFSYDNLNRLTGMSGNGVPTRSFAYNEIGNLTYKSDVGDYIYPDSGAGSVRPHAVHCVTGSRSGCLDYDANGSLISASYNNNDSRTVAYTAANMPSTIQGWRSGSSVATYQYVYGAEHQRVKSIVTTAAGTSVTRYLNPDNAGGLFFEEETLPNGTVESRYYLNGGNGLFGVYVNHGGQSQMRYFLKDHQGSIVAVIDEHWSELERFSYEAFGERRYPNGQPEDRNAPIIGLTTERGYTAHEHMDELMLINMNGRVFDPVLGRFMSADPNIDGTYELQGYNRYSYVMNNPLNATDPTGYWSFAKWISRTLTAAVVPTDRNTLRAVQVQPFQSTIDRYIAKNKTAYAIGQTVVTAVGTFFGGTMGGAAAAATWQEYYAYYQTGDMWAARKAGAISFATSMALYEVGTALPANTSPFANVLGQAAVGCANAAASGGNCSQGAMSAAAGAAWSNYGVKFDDFSSNLAAQYVVGGTVTALGGGKFANGGATYSMVYLTKFAPAIYEDLVGYPVDMGPGGDAVEKGFTQPPVKGANNIGTQGGPLDPDCYFCEGGIVSRAANYVPGINAVAGLHDWMQIHMDPGFMRNVANVPLMPVAALATYGAEFGNILNSIPRPIYIYRQPKIDKSGKTVYQQPQVMW